MTLKPLGAEARRLAGKNVGSAAILAVKNPQNLSHLWIDKALKKGKKLWI